MVRLCAERAATTAGLKQLYDYAHSVFPLEKWWHELGPFAITGAGDEARAEWRWIVNWRSERCR